MNTISPRRLRGVIEQQILSGLHMLPAGEFTDDKVNEIVRVAVRQSVAKVCARRGQKVRAVWDTLDRMKSAGQIPTIAEVRRIAAKRRWNGNTARVQFYLWKSNQELSH